MKHSILTAVITMIFVLSTHAKAADTKPLHLFILSGQSNMELLNPNHTFKPALQGAFGTEHVLVVKNAIGGQPIRRWYKKWAVEGDEDSKQVGDLYDALMTDIKMALGDRNPTTITFLWMQGERDTSQKRAHDYSVALKGLIEQLRHDLNQPDMNVVIGRLSDYGNDKLDERPSWNAIRDIQMQIAKSDSYGAWVDTDDLNGTTNDLHYTGKGYDEFGKRLAGKAIELIRAENVTAKILSGRPDMVTGEGCSDYAQ